MERGLDGLEILGGGEGGCGLGGLRVEEGLLGGQLMESSSIITSSFIDKSQSKSL